MKLSAPFATAVGTLPHRDPAAALDLTLRSLPIAPCWPQLPQRSWLENMDAQFAEGLPGLSEDPEAKRVSVRVSGPGSHPEAELERFWAPLVSGDDDPERLALSVERAAGLHELLQRFKAGGLPRFPIIKGQMTGPVTFGSMVKTADAGRLLLFEPAFFEAARALLRAKAAWQTARLKPLGERVLVFVDEPALVGFGSAFLPISRQQAIDWLDEVVAGVHEQGGLAGSHCCGNTDWSLLTGSKVDIVNFDAHAFFDHVLLYSRDLAAFLERGGYLAFGSVPTYEAVLLLTADGLAHKLDAQLDRLSKEVGLTRSTLYERLIVTPACGFGTRSEQAAEIGLGLSQRIVKLLGGA